MLLRTARRFTPKSHHDMLVYCSQARLVATQSRCAFGYSVGPCYDYTCAIQTELYIYLFVRTCPHIYSTYLFIDRPCIFENMAIY